ncbi:hypothetical protein ACIBJE_01205 [Micromonospora sp. NPDC050187]|uniref:hypothetical protein n=1 Tax=Micromonospora sp. NPDC050187 TaxID=3364277 RepID=UPI0037B3424F
MTVWDSRVAAGVAGAGPAAAVGGRTTATPTATRPAAVTAASNRRRPEAKGYEGEGMRRFYRRRSRW